MKKDKKGAHNLRRSEMKELQEQQASGQEPKMMKANGKDAPEDFKIKVAEKDFVHFQLEDRLYSQTDGSKLSTPYVQVMAVKEYEEAEKNKAFLGKAVAIYHYPKSATKELGSAVEGARIVDSDFAAQQVKFEALTGSRPPADWTPTQLDAAIKFTELFPAGATQPLAPISQEANKTNVPPVILGTPAGNATVAQNADISSPGALAALAADAARNTPLTLDGTTAAGQETKAVENTSGNNEGGTSNVENNGNKEAEKAKDDADKAKGDAADKDAEKIPAGAGKRPSNLEAAAAKAAADTKAKQ